MSGEPHVRLPESDDRGPSLLMQGLEDIESAFHRVKNSAEKFVDTGDQSSKEQSFQNIFDLNNEIGRVGRQIPGAMPSMKELQACVNMITVALKHGRVGGVRESISATEKAIKGLQTDGAVTS